MNRLRKLLAQEDGVSLIEILVAITIMAIVIVASGSLMVSALRVQTDSAATDQAAQLARDQNETYRAVSYSKLSLPPSSPSQTSDGYYTVVASAIGDSTIDADARTVSAGGFTYELKTEVVWYGPPAIGDPSFPSDTKYKREEVYNATNGKCSGGKLLRTTASWLGSTGPMEATVQAVILPGFELCAALAADN